jgi:hypothetical protein
MNPAGMIFTECQSQRAWIFNASAATGFLLLGNNQWFSATAINNWATFNRDAE